MAASRMASARPSLCPGTRSWPVRPNTTSIRTSARARRTCSSSPPPAGRTAPSPRSSARRRWRRGRLLRRSVAISGNTVVVGAPEHKVGAAEQGSAYVLHQARGWWGETKGDTATTELTAADGGVGDHFGFAVAASGDTVFVGAPEHQVAPQPSGRGLRVRQAVLRLEPEHDPDRGADRVRRSDGRPARHKPRGVRRLRPRRSAPAPSRRPTPVKAPRICSPGPATCGPSARQTEQLTASDGATGDIFGISVGLAGNLAVVGAVPKIGDNVHQGATYLFGVPPTIAIASPTDGATYTQNSIIARVLLVHRRRRSDDHRLHRTHRGRGADRHLDARSAHVHGHRERQRRYHRDPIGRPTRSFGHGAGRTNPEPSRSSITAVHQSASVWRSGGAPAADRPPAPPGRHDLLIRAQPARARQPELSAGAHPVADRHGRCASPSVQNKRQPRCTRTLSRGHTDAQRARHGLNRSASKAGSPATRRCAQAATRWHDHRHHTGGATREFTAAALHGRELRRADHRPPVRRDFKPKES